MPQKKFVTTEMDNGFDQQTLAFQNGFEETSLGEFRKLLANLVCEGIFFTITGIDPSVEVSITDDNRGNKHVDARNRTTKGSGKKKRTKSKKAKRFSSNSFLPTLLADIQCILFIVEFEPVTLSLSLSLPIEWPASTYYSCSYAVFRKECVPQRKLHDKL